MIWIIFIDAIEEYFHSSYQRYQQGKFIKQLPEKASNRSKAHHEWSTAHPVRTTTCSEKINSTSWMINNISRMINIHPKRSTDILNDQQQVYKNQQPCPQRIFIWFLANAAKKFHIAGEKTFYRIKTLYHDNFYFYFLLTGTLPLYILLFFLYIVFVCKFRPQESQSDVLGDLCRMISLVVGPYFDIFERNIFLRMWFVSYQKRGTDVNMIR